MPKCYCVLVNDKVVKTYKYRIQAIIYCLLKGYVYSGTSEWSGKYHSFLDPKVKIRERNRNY